MRNKNNIMLFFIILVSLVISYSFYTLISNIENDKSTEFKSENIQYIADNTQNLLSRYFLEKQSESNHYANTNFAKEILKENFISSKDVAIREAEKYSFLRIRELENYIIFNRDLTLDEMRESIGFRKIVTASIGENGYSGVIDDEIKLLFHPNPLLEGLFVSDVIETPELLSLIETLSLYGGKSFVEYELINDTSQKKIAYVERSNLQTSDSKNLFLFTSTVIDDYKIPQNIPNNNDFNLIKILNAHEDYVKILIISKDGYVAYGDSDLIGLNLFFENNEIGDFLGKSERDFIFGPIYNIKEELVFVVSNPVYDNSEFLGYLILQIDAEHIYDLIEKESSMNKVFLINEKSLLVSPLNNYSILSQEINDIDSEECLDELINNEYYDSGVFEYDNPYGEKMLRVHRKINNPNLCIFVESQKDYYDEYFHKIKNSKIIFSLFVLFSAIAIIYLFLFKSKIKIFEHRKRKVEHDFSNKMNDIDDFKFIITCVISILIFFYILNYYLFDFSINNFLTQSFEFGSLTFILIAIKFGSKYKNNKLFLNTMFVVLISKISLILLHAGELYVNGDIDPSLWAIPISITCFSIPVLLSGVRRMKK